MDRVALHPAEPGLDVGADLLERRADVRAAVGIVDRRREIIACLCVVHHPDPRSPARRSGRATEPCSRAMPSPRPPIINQTRPAGGRFARPVGAGPIYHKREYRPDEGPTERRVMPGHASRSARAGPANWPRRPSDGAIRSVLGSGLAGGIRFCGSEIAGDVGCPSTSVPRSVASWWSPGHHMLESTVVRRPGQRRSCASTRTPSLGW